MTPAFGLEKLPPSGSVDLGTLLPYWSVLPFAGLLLSLALFPLFAPKFWQRNYHFVVMSWGLMLAVPLLWFFGKPVMTEICHMILLDYIPFMILLLSLFAVAGGIYIKGTFKGTPLTNLILLVPYLWARTPISATRQILWCALSPSKTVSKCPAFSDIWYIRLLF